MSWVFAGQVRWARAPSGRRWSSLATVERPRTAQGRPSFAALLGGRHPRCAPSMRPVPNLSRRQPATTVGAPTDQARVCLAAPPPALATLPMPSPRASHDGRAATTMPEPSGKLRASRASFVAACGGAVSALGGRSTGSPGVPARSGTGTVPQPSITVVQADRQAVARYRDWSVTEPFPSSV